MSIFKRKQKPGPEIIEAETITTKATEPVAAAIEAIEAIETPHPQATTKIKLELTTEELKHVVEALDKDEEVHLYLKANEGAQKFELLQVLYNMLPKE